MYVIQERDVSFGSLLRSLRASLGLTQEELAGRAGLTAKAISALERGERRRPYPHTVRSLAAALDLSDGERVGFVSAASGGGEASTPRAPVERGGIPHPPTPLLGREKELGEVGAFLGVSGVQLLTLTGTGGVGKTRLAVEAAREAAGRFSEGAVFVGLAPLSGCEQVLPAVCRAMGLREGQSARETLRAHLRGREMLLVLDNLEHVLEAAPEISGLIESADKLTVLATSRAPLRVRAEQEYPVPPLALPASTRSPAAGEVSDSPAGRLFAERAGEALPAFEITEGNAGAVASICWRLSGLPLALELAAAKVRFLDPAGILARLDRALSAGWARDLPERQRTMRSTLDWSHELLGSPERTLFRRLSVFSGGFSLESAEAVGSDGDLAAEAVLDLLGELVEQSLVFVEQGSGRTRYGMLEPVRQYALEKLDESGEANDFSRRHAERYHALALEAGPALMGEEQVVWLEMLWSEKYNLVAAMRFLLDIGDDERAVGLTWALWRYWWISGQLRESRRWMEEVLTEDEGELSTGRRAQANLTIGTMAWSEGDVGEALPALERGLELSRQTDDARSQAIALMLLGLVEIAEGGAEAHGCFEESLRLYRVADEEWGEALTLNYLGLTPLLGGDYEKAGSHFEEGLAAARSAGDRIAAHQALLNLAFLDLLREDGERAAKRLSEGLSLATEVRDILNAAYFVKGLGQVAGLRGACVAAVRLLGAAESAFEAVGSRPYRYVPDDALQNTVLAAARKELGEPRFTEEWSRGGKMTLERAITEALETESQF